MTTHRNPEVSTTQYQFVHGQKPRGFGLWIFMVRWHMPMGTARVETYESFSVPATIYTKALRAALVQARACNAFRVEVCP